MGLTYLQRLNAARTGYTPPGDGPDKNQAAEPITPKKVSKAAKAAFWKEAIASLTGQCPCGCGQSTQRLKHSVAHILPKAIFKSVMIHPENFVERAFWGGCHTNMDQRGLDKWPSMADWPVIKRKFLILQPLLTSEEKKHKFYKHLKRLVEAN